MTTLFLPYPPSVNGLFANRKGGRRKTAKYTAWLNDAAEDLKVAKYYDGFKWKNHTGKVKITLMLKAPDNRRRDIDNLIKPVLDFLVTHKVIAGDDSRYVQSIMAGWWNKRMKESGCFVIIEDCEESI
jgi:Holliday junction resolvase RusA-like endonuclease